MYVCTYARNICTMYVRISGHVYPMSSSLTHNFLTYSSVGYWHTDIGTILHICMHTCNKLMNSNISTLIEINN